EDTHRHALTAEASLSWVGTVRAGVALPQLAAGNPRGDGDAGSAKRTARQVVAAVRLFADRLGNTPAVCRKCYVHPDVIASYLDGTPILISKSRSHARRGGLSAEERAVLRFLKKSLERGDAKSESLEETLRRSVKRARGRNSSR